MALRKRKFKRGDHISIVSLDDKNEYIEFIEKMKIHKFTGGTKLQVHHIVPFHDGASDSPENLVSLSHEDHVFAHLLIAKVYDSEIDKMTSRLMLEMGRNIYHTVRVMGASKTHQILKR